MNDFMKGRARMIFAILGGFLFLVLQAVFPQLPFSEGQTVLFMGLIGAYVLGEGIGGQVVSDNFASMIKSQKFQGLIVGLLVTLVKSFFPDLAISDAELMTFVGAIMTFIVGAGIGKASSIPTPVVVEGLYELEEEDERVLTK